MPATHTLLHSPSHIIQQLLVNSTIVSDPVEEQPWPCFIDRQPDSPDNTLVCTLTSPTQLGRIQFDGRSVQGYGIQVLGRGLIPTQVWGRLNSVQNYFDRTVKRTLVTLPDDEENDQHYLVHSVNTISGIMSLGVEMQTGRRFEYSLNVVATITQAL